MKRFLLLIVVLIVHGSLYPWSLHYRHLSASPLWIVLHSWPHSLFNRVVFRDVIVNLLLYFPLGAVAFLAVRPTRRRWTAYVLPVLLGASLSASMEMLQLFDPGRTCSLMDLVTNTTGAAAGMLAAALCRGRLESLRDRGWWPHPSAALALAGLWIAAQLFPFFPSLSRTQARRKLAALALPGAFTAVPTLGYFAEWLALEQVLRACLGPRRARAAMILLVCLLPLKFLILGRSTSLSELVGAGAGLAIGLLFDLSPLSVAGIQTAALVLTGLSPFRFHSAPTPFLWQPFEGALRYRFLETGIVMLHKSFLYGAAVWLWAAGGFGYVAGTALTALLLAGVEFAQRYLPGHVPEITDPLLAVLLGLLLAGTDAAAAAAKRREPGLRAEPGT